MQFEWTSFYSEFATKLLEFKDNRAELIADIQSAYSAINMKLPKLESEDSIIDIVIITMRQSRLSGRLRASVPVT